MQRGVKSITVTEVIHVLDDDELIQNAVQRASGEAIRQVREEVGSLFKGHDYSVLSYSITSLPSQMQGNLRLLLVIVVQAVEFTE